jgi:hypothetical protein
MKKLSLGLLVACTTTVLSGCALYFGESHDGDDNWTYCGADGYYQCEDDDCEWVSSTCPDGGSGGGGSGSGGEFECQDNDDCAAGCYCGNGVCEEAGFCTQDSDCGEGYTCNEERASCEPDASCDWDYECAQGEYCSPDTNTCTATCVCTDDESAVGQGYGWCDETRSTCLPGQDPAGTCGGTGGTSCMTFKPNCPSGQVPELIDGCYTGSCRAYGECDVNPVCENINDETNCLGQAGCDDVQNGINCRDANGNNCQPGAGCTCDSYVFAACKSL